MSVPSTQHQPTRRLRVLQAVHDGDWELYRHIRQYLLIATVWAVASLAASYALANGVVFAGNLGPSDPLMSEIASGWFLFLAIAAAWLVPIAAFARVCLRSIVLSEPPTVAGAFRFDRAFGRFLGTIVGITVIVGVLIAVPHSLSFTVKVSPEAAPDSTGYGLIHWLVVLVIAMASSPFALALPIAATDTRSRPIRDGFRMGSGRRAQLFGLLLLGMAPLMLLPTAWQWLFGFVFEWLALGRVFDWILWLLYAFGWWILVSLSVVALAGALASAYLQLTAARADRDIASVFD